MWFGNNTNKPSTALCALPPRAAIAMNPILVAARADTSHTTGPGQFAITGKYDSKKDSFVVEAAYAFDDNNTVYTTYAVTDERVSSVGLESGMSAFGRRLTLDMTGFPPRDATALKLAIRQGKTKVASTFSFDSVQDRKTTAMRARYELDAKLSAAESLKMSFDAKSHAAKVKVSRKLDPKNKLDAEYNYIDADSKFLSVKFAHQYNSTHSFAVTANYGSRKYIVDWDCKTDNGPWTVSSSFPFNASPHTGDWQVKRRFEF